MKEQLVWRVTLLRNNLGFTLTEVVVALVILMIGMMALLQSVNIAFEHNLRNQQRDEVVRVASDIMNGMRAQTFGTTFNAFTTVPSKMLQMNRTYTVVRSVTTMASGSQQYQVNVRWAYKGYTTNHAIVTVRGVQ